MGLLYGRLYFNKINKILWLQEQGSDSNVMGLREALQQIERTGLVDFKLGGHRCERPPAVQQGRDDDHFELQADPSSALLWKPNTIAVKNLKFTNVASHFVWSKLQSSNLQLAP